MLTIACVVAGILLASAALEDTLKITVTDTEVQFQKNKRTRRVPREQIQVAFLDGKDIVLQAADSRELARERHDQLKSEAQGISAAFEAHGYPWSSAGDPYRDAFRRWVEDDPALPPAVNAVLRARSKAIALGHKGKADARELRDEVAKLGYAIRDENANQYWRSTTQHQ
jgi:cysteinyl-tRNA synthetase